MDDNRYPVQSFSHSLTCEELNKFERDGWIGPYAAYTDSFDEIAKELVEIHTRDEVCPIYGIRTARDRYLVSDLVKSLATHPAIVDRVRVLLGPDVVLWGSHFFNKAPEKNLAANTEGSEFSYSEPRKLYRESGRVEWHAGGLFEAPMHPERFTLGSRTQTNREALEHLPHHITCWFALTDATTQNGCVEFLRGSNNFKILPRKKIAADDGVYGLQTGWAWNYDDRSENVDVVPVRAGSFLLFPNTTVHRTGPNLTDQYRPAIAFRYCPAHVPVYDKLTEDCVGVDVTGHRCVLVCGQDRYGVNKIIGGYPYVGQTEEPL
jgi:non-heme Fe2+,alpha-ketoglutarate-dependent halogenase